MLNAGNSNPLYSIYCVNANTVYAVGDTGTIIKTTDGGNHWTKQTTGTNNALYSILFLNENTGYAVGAMGIVLKTTDGNNWVKLNTGTGYGLSSISFMNADTGWIAGSNGDFWLPGNVGILLSTYDGGKTWMSQSFPDYGLYLLCILLMLLQSGCISRIQYVPL